MIGSAMSAVGARPAAVVAAYVVVCVAAMLTFQSDGRLSPSGDEPHYLIVADAIVRHGTIETTAAYIDESVRHEYYDGELVPGFPHAVTNERGQFSVHGVGVPSMVALPLRVGGVTGARVAMIAIGALGMFAAWGFAMGMGIGRSEAAIALSSIALSYAFVPSASQIYPDLPAGVIALIGALGLLRLTTAAADRQALVGGVVGSAAVGWLSFVHLKTGPIAVYLLALLVVAAWRRFPDRARVAAVAAPGAVLGIGALMLTWWLYGSLRGPYDSSALLFDDMAATVIAGLYVDQFQGLFAQAPILLVGVGALVPFIRRFPLPGAALIGSHLAFTVPNGLHPVWYGGTSYAGRFAVAGGVLLIPPTIYGLAWLLRRDRVLAFAVIGASAVAFVAAMVRALGSGARLGNAKYVDPDVYVSHAPWIRGVLPMFYRPAWAFTYPPNLAALTVVVVLLIGGALLPGRGVRMSQRWVAGTVVVLALVAVIGGRVAGPDRQRFDACLCDMGTDVGRWVDGVLVTGEASGFVAYGPGAVLDGGRHEILLLLDVTEGAREIGTWEAALLGETAEAGGILPATTGRHEVRVPIDVPPSRDGHPVEVRLWWSGAGSFRLLGVVVDPDGEAP